MLRLFENADSISAIVPPQEYFLLVPMFMMHLLIRVYT
jgi:hypothetical protein